MNKFYAFFLVSFFGSQLMMGMEKTKSEEATESTNRVAAPAQQRAAQQVPPVVAQNPVPAPNVAPEATGIRAYLRNLLTRSQPQQAAQAQVPAAQPAAASSTNKVAKFKPGKALRDLSEAVKQSESPKNASEPSSVPITSATSPVLDGDSTQTKGQGAPTDHDKLRFFIERFEAQEGRIQELEQNLAEAESRATQAEVARLEAQNQLEENQKQNKGLKATLQENEIASDTDEKPTVKETSSTTENEADEARMEQEAQKSAEAETARVEIEEEKKVREEAQEELTREQLQSIHPEVVKFYAVHRMSPLMLAVIWGNIDLVRSFLDNPLTDVNAVDAQGRNALMQLFDNLRGLRGPRYWSFQRNFGDFLAVSPDIVRLLIDKNIDLNARDKNGYTALMYAAMHGFKEIAIIILQKKGVGLDTRGYYDRKTAALLAAQYSNGNRYSKEILGLLVRAGADISEIQDPKLQVYIAESLSTPL